MELRIIKGWKKAKTRIMVLDFKRPDFSLFRDLLDESIQDHIEERSRRVGGFFLLPKESLPASSRVVHTSVQEDLQRWQEGLHG